MQLLELNLIDQARSRSIPICIYTPEQSAKILPVVIFSPGYQDQSSLQQSGAKLACKKFEYLAEYFASKGYAFISIQHEILGNNDGLEVIDKSLPQAEARKHLWARGEQNILFVINELKKQFLEFNFNKFIIAGHSNGGDIAKFFANNHETNISHVICFDGRRCPIAPYTKQKLLMFEAWDTSTDIGVIPDEGTENAPKRKDLERIIIKPKGAKHMDYQGEYINDNLKQNVFKTIEFFLNS